MRLPLEGGFGSGEAREGGRPSPILQPKFLRPFKRSGTGNVVFGLGHGVVGEPEEEVFEDVELDFGGGRGRFEEGGAEIGERPRIGSKEEGADPVRESFGGEDEFDEGEAVDGGYGSGEGAGGGEEGEEDWGEVVGVAVVDPGIGGSGVVVAEELGD